MKKFLAIVIAIMLIITACVFCACEGEELTMYVPDGAPALSVAKIINDGKVANHKVTSVVTTGEDVVAKCASGEADLAVLPTNAAVTICNKRDDYQIFSVNVYGVLYIVGTSHIESISELEGETLYSIGQANTPEFVFKEICERKSIDYSVITINFQPDASTIIPQILNGNAKFALIGEPAVTQLKNKAASLGKSVEVLFDLQEEWQEATGSEQKGYPQASLIVKKELLTDKFAAELMKSLTANKQFILSHCDQLNGIMRNAGSSLDLNYTSELLERCNLTAISASSAKADVERYLSTFKAMANFLPLSDDIIYEAKD